jgi:heterodisulfide reductase subunit A-like polyferredoxin
VIVPKPKGVLRIVCVGGSTTEEGNDTQSTYPNIMEHKLRNYFKTDKIDVVNVVFVGGRSFGRMSPY